MITSGLDLNQPVRGVFAIVSPIGTERANALRTGIAFRQMPAGLRWAQLDAQGFLYQLFQLRLPVTCKRPQADFYREEIAVISD